MAMKRAVCFLSAVLLAFGLTACNNIQSGSAGTETGEKIKTDSGIEIPEINLGENNTIQIVSTGNPRYNTKDGLIAKYFEKYYGGEISLKQVSTNELGTMLASSVSAGTPPHLIEMNGGFPSYTISNLIAPVDDVGVNYGEKQFDDLKFIYDSYTYDGKHYVLPWSSLAYQKIFYNVKIFEDNELETPKELFDQGAWTYDTFYDTVKALYLDEDRNGTPERYGLAVAGYHAGALAYGGGEQLIKIDGKKLVNNVSGNAFSTGFNLLKKMIITDKLVPQNFGEDYVADLFASGNAAMVLGPFFWCQQADLFSNMRASRSLEWVVLPKATANGEHYVYGKTGAYYMPTGVKKADYPLIKAFMYTSLVELYSEGVEGTDIYQAGQDEWLGNFTDYGYTKDDYKAYRELNSRNDCIVVMEPLDSIVFADAFFNQMISDNKSFEQAVAILSPEIDAELQYLVEDAQDVAITTGAGTDSGKTEK